MQFSCLANRAAPLPLHAGRLLSLLHVARFVDDADRIRTGMVIDDNLMESITQGVFVPAVVSQELLQGSRRDSGCQSHWLAALGRQVRKLALDIHGKACPCVASREAIAKLLEVASQLRLQPANLIGVHAICSMSFLNLGQDIDSPI